MGEQGVFQLILCVLLGILVEFMSPVKKELCVGLESPHAQLMERRQKIAAFGSHSSMTDGKRKAPQMILDNF